MKEEAPQDLVTPLRSVPKLSNYVRHVCLKDYRPLGMTTAIVLY